jgi:hypothetical protein
MIRSTFVLVLCAAVLAFAEHVRAADSEPAPRRLTVGAELLVSAATRDRGYFNDSSYGRSAMRLLRGRLDLSLRLGDRAAVLAEGRADNGDGLTVAALYLRVRPLRDRPFDIQAGRIPPVFGAFARRGYGSDNPLMGAPLAYQYLTSLRDDSLPATADDLLVMRGRGWRNHYPLGSGDWDRGLPLVFGDRWDTGVEVRIGEHPVSFTAAVSQGTLSAPRVRDDNGGKQVSARLEARPLVGLILGASAARGEYLTREASGAIPAAVRRGSYAQAGLGLDAEYSRGYWLVRSEAVLSRWSVPAVQAPELTGALRAWSGFVEGRYKIRPRLYAAARVDTLRFNDVKGTLLGGRPTPWDAPVARVEVGMGYSVRRNLLVKGVLQRNWRSGVLFGATQNVAGAQALFWF